MGSIYPGSGVAAGAGVRQPFGDDGALNVVAGQNLAWQERKATSFVFTPKYCGYDVDRAMLSKDPSLSSEGFVPTKEFYSGGGPAIGTAMAL